jgi:fumarylacetoacetate (FAA) hydrolase
VFRCPVCGKSFNRTTCDGTLSPHKGLSDRFYPAHGEVPFRSEADDIDFEAEFGVILDATPLGVSAAEALKHVRLVVMINDWSLSAFGPSEMKGGFGFLQAKPPCSLSAFAVTPDELGDAWRDGRVGLNLTVHRGEALFGSPDGVAMSYGFGDLIAHAAATRDLCAGTLIGSGTVSNFDAEKVGSGCIAERKALDELAPNNAAASYLRFGESVRMEALNAAGQSVFGAIEQHVARRPTNC